ncbi:MAG: hypothetical protein IJZ59_04945 [Alphaproteobacteria bacterium]|nr:hypothetical protein [Alphaproteobacteria bacterium]
MKEKDESGWLFPEFFKAAVDTEDPLPFGARVLSVMTGTGLMIVEPIAKIGSALGLDSDYVSDSDD